MRVFKIILIFCCLAGAGCLKPKTEAADTADGSSSELTGTWSETCRDDGGTKVSMSWTFSGSQMTATTTLFGSSASCSSSDRTQGFKATVTVEVGSANSFITSATNIKFSTTKLEYIAYSQAVADDLNSTSECGRSNWTPNVWTDVTGTSCNSALYQIYKIEGGNKFYLGDTSGSYDGSSEANRPRQLNSYYLSKQ